MVSIIYAGQMYEKILMGVKNVFLYHQLPCQKDARSFGIKAFSDKWNQFVFYSMWYSFECTKKHFLISFYSYCCIEKVWLFIHPSLLHFLYQKYEIKGTVGMGSKYFKGLFIWGEVAQLGELAPLGEMIFSPCSYGIFYLTSIKKFFYVAGKDRFDYCTRFLNGFKFFRIF